MVVLVVLGVALLMMLVEARHPARRWPRVAGWWRRAALVNGFQIAAVFLAGVTWEPWLRQHRWLPLADWPTGYQVVLGYLANVLWLYAAHRARHRFTFLWRGLHQLHHSPARIELLTAFYKHPLEIVAESMATGILLFVVLGLSPRAVLVISIMGGSANLFYHWNVSTPRWLGYIIQRPESHCVHHQQGVHAYNYSELPLVDMVFGTFRNPPRFDRPCGFGHADAERLWPLLWGRDVTAVRE